MTNKTLEDLIQQWLEIAKTHANAKEILDEFYEKEIFPITYDLFIQNNKLEDKHFDGLIMTVGTSPEPMIYSIGAINPKRLLFLYTEGSERYLDKVINFTSLKPSGYDKEQIERPYPISIYQSVFKTLNKWKKQDIKKIAVDITAGMKTMTGGLAMVGAMLNFQLTYIGNTDYLAELRRPRPGTEFLEFIDNPYSVFGTLKENDAEALMKRYDYKGASEIYKELSEKHPEPIKYRIKYHEAIAHHHLDLLNFEDAADSFEDTARLDSQRNISNPNIELLEKAEKLRHLSSLMPKNLKDSSLTLLQDTEAIIQLIEILYHNAHKRAELDRLDAASLYLYRLIEILAQRRLAVHDIDSSSPDYSKIKIPEKDILNSLNTVRSSEKMQELLSLPSEISLINGYMLLEVIKDGFNLSIKKSISLKRMLSHTMNRNYSVLAHGFSFVSQKQYTGFKNFVDDLLSLFSKVEGANGKLKCTNGGK